MKNFFSRSLKTTLFGLGSIACIVVPIFIPVAAPVCAKFATLLGGLGLVAARDHSDGNPPSRSPNKLNSFGVLPLVALLLVATVASSSGFISQYQPTSYRVFIGTGNPNTNSWATNSGTGSFFVNVEDVAVPVLWVKTSTNGFATVASGGGGAVVESTGTPGNAAAADYAVNATHAINADSATVADSANSASTALTSGTASFADSATSAMNADHADRSRILHNVATENVVEYINIGSGAWASSTDIQGVGLRVQNRTNIISIKPSAVAAFLALVPGGLVTNSMPVTLPQL